MKVFLLTNEEYECVQKALEDAHNVYPKTGGYADVWVKLKKQAEKQGDSTLIPLMVPSLDAIFMAGEPATKSD